MWLTRIFITGFKTNTSRIKVKVCFYTAQYLVRWTALSALYFTPWQTCSFRHQLDFSGKHSVTQKLRATTKSLTFSPLSIVMHSFKQLRTGALRRMKMPKIQNGGFEPGITRLRVRHSTAEITRSTNMRGMSAQIKRL